ncbi:DUF937 domain-containing protein [Caballeronia sp. LZ025]|uniref:DUF937 domain-containing protein n=2 Tax=Caballeronia TaxID=1827195 RepID=UPI001FD60837|nr:DUF937 domain-containing protein [Caballeronia grimmiae]MDR5733124.1 DUF937 domain-containing protein [Caballeronia sp. LZ025]
MNLNQLVQGALNESVLQQLASRVGCTPESAKRVISLCGPALIGSMMNKASSLDGARNLFASVMSPSVNTHIADERRASSSMTKACSRCWQRVRRWKARLRRTTASTC